MRTNSRSLAMAAAGLVVTAGVAYAAWSATGTGPAASTTATAKPLSVIASSVEAGLYPGGPAGAIGFTVTNDNPYDVRLTAVSYGALGTGGSACAAEHVTRLAGAPTAVDLLVPAGTSVGSTVPGVLALAMAAPDACQGVPLTVGLTLTGTQVSS